MERRVKLQKTQHNGRGRMMEHNSRYNKIGKRGKRGVG